MKIQTIASIISISLALGLATQARASEGADTGAANGFYGGVSVRDTGAEGIGVHFGAAAASALNRYPVAAFDDTTSPRTLVFGGYRLQHDLAVEASFSSQDKYALQPLDSGSARRGIGLTFGSTAGDLQARSWNLDVITSWTVYKAVALYGRFGYAQTEAPPLPGLAPVTISAARGLRDGMNYGVGVRYDMNSSLGLRVEYSRFGRFAGELGTSLPETDQVTFGLQLKF
jgi:opacity protein-like surface antigen